LLGEEFASVGIKSVLPQYLIYDEYVNFNKGRKAPKFGGKVGREVLVGGDRN